MTELTLAPSRFDEARERVLAFAKANSGALVLGCMLSAALGVWMIPAAAETRCMLATQRGLGMQGALSLSFAMTALGWWAHKPAQRFLRSRRPDESAPPSE
jgi:hypothetical protein